MKSKLIKFLIKFCFWATLNVVFLFPILCHAQTNQDSIYNNYLFYLCKSWGHFKYYHTNVATGFVDWDDVLITSIRDLKTASTDEEFNMVLEDLLLQAGEMWEATEQFNPPPDSLNNNSDISWMNDSILSINNQQLLNNVYENIRSLNYTYLSQYQGIGNAYFILDSTYYGSSELTEEIRLLALFRYWNMIYYFFPYKNIMDQDWDTTLKEFIPEIRMASAELSYSLAMKALTTRINDTHAAFWSPSYYQWRGEFYTPFDARIIEDEIVITEVLPHINDIKIGDVVTRIDNKDVRQLREEMKQYIGGSNNSSIDRDICQTILLGPYGYFDIEVLNADGLRENSFLRTASNDNYLGINNSPIWYDTLINNQCHYGIVDMGRLEENHVDQMMEDLRETDVIIFDVRNYPNNTIFRIVNYLFDQEIHMANFKIPSINYPGTFYFSTDHRIGDINNKPNYEGEIKILLDERTQSHAEFTIMGLEEYPRVTKIGSQTAGADGNVSLILLPGYIQTLISGLGVYYPDGRPTQRIGIVPDIYIKPTIEGIRNGIDEIMEAALICESTSSRFDEAWDSDIKIIPSPASELISIENIPANTREIRIYSAEGVLIKSLNDPFDNEDINISNLNSGIYFVRLIGDNNYTIQPFIKI